MARHDPSRRDLLVAASAFGLLGRARHHFTRPSSSAAPTTGGDRSLTELGARAAVERIRSGDLAAETYFSALIEQYQAHRDLNLVNWIDPAVVLEAARSVDKARAKGTRLGPAAGLPLGVKDQIEVAGYPSSGGNGALKGYRPRRNAVVVERLVRAGAIPFCMTACPDMTVIDGLMHQASSHSDSFGAVHNPYDPTRIPGGSSGGSGGALASRIVPAALGEDTNGSVRLPSAMCGTVGLRPSTFTLRNAIQGTRRKRYSDLGLMLQPARRLDTIGPMARTVADVAFLDTLITGQPTPTIDPRRVRIAVPRPDYWEREAIDPAVAEVVRAAFRKLGDAGFRLVEIDFLGEVRGIVGSFDHPTPASIVAGSGLDAPAPSRETLIAWLREHAPDVTVEQMTRGRPVFDERAQGLPPRAEQLRIATEAERRYAGIYRSHDVVAIAHPTAPIVAPPLSPDGPKEPLGAMMTVNGQQIEEGKLLIRNIFIAPRLGAPGLSIPAGMANGLPVGIEFDALPGNDSALLGLGIAIEKVLGALPAPF
jgi:mandelamide amidase